jgi:SAM-dependent methyltransferase
MTDDPYQGFADRYDLFYGEFGRYDKAEVAFFRKLFQDHSVKSVLDCACGTGRHLPLFHSLGCQVAGSDLSPAMLAQARRNLAGLNLNVSLHQIDYRELSAHLDWHFDAVVCLSSSLLHMGTRADALRALRSMRGVLREGGLLILSQGTTDRQWREKPRFILAANSRDFSRLFAIDYAGQGARYNILDVYHTGRSNELKVWSIDYPRVWLQADQERLLKEAGFSRTDFYGSYTLEPYDREESNILIAVAKR